MELSFFETQMKRLKEQWPSAYSSERYKIFFNAFRDVSNFDFRDAVSHCLAHSRGAPLLPELTEAIVKARSNYFEQKRITELDQKNAFLNIKDDGVSCDKEFKEKCVELYKNFMDRKITAEQFYQGCDLLDQASKLFKTTKPNPPTNSSSPDEKPF